MDIKLCKKCQKYKPFELFGKKKTSKDGYKYNCRECCNFLNRYNKKIFNHCNVCNKDKEIEEMKTRYRCITCVKICKKKNRDKYNKTEKGKENNKISKQNWKNYNMNYNKNYYEKNKDVIIEKALKYLNDKYKKNTEFKLISNIRCRLYKFLKANNISKTNTTIKSIGCSPEYLRKWLFFNIELDNLNEYHIDHLKPLSSFKLTSYEDVIKSKCNHWTNVIPLLPIDNIKKSNREPTKKELFRQELRIKIFKMTNNL